MELRLYLQILWKKWWIVLAACLSTVVAVGVFTFSQAPTYRATATYVVTPSGGYEDARSAAESLDMLSRRAEIATTYAEVANSRFIKQQAADELGLSSAQRRDLSVDSHLLAGTNILEIEVEGSNPQLVQFFTDVVGFKTATYVQELYEAYSLKPLDLASLPNSPVGPGKMVNLAIGGILGLGLGAGLAFLAHYLETPAETAARPVIPAGSLAGVAGGRRESGGALAQAPERMVLTGTSRRPGAPSRRRAVGWIVGATLALVLIAGGLAAWLSGRETSAASPPEATPVAGLMATITWTGTATALPTATAAPAAMVTTTATSEPLPTLCVLRSGWLVYAVQEGDTLSSLAVSYGVSEAEIIEANCLSGDTISGFQTLLLPPRSEALASTPSSAASETATPTSSETATPTSSETATPTSSETPVATATPSPTQSDIPSPTQTSTPSPTPTPPRSSPTQTKPVSPVHPCQLPRC